MPFPLPRALETIHSIWNASPVHEPMRSPQPHTLDLVWNWGDACGHCPDPRPPLSLPLGVSHCLHHGEVP